MSSPEYSRCYSIRSAEGAEAEAEAYYPHLHVCTTCGEGKQTARILRGKLEKGGRWFRNCFIGTVDDSNPL